MKTTTKRRINNIAWIVTATGCMLTCYITWTEYDLISFFVSLLFYGGVCLLMWWQIDSTIKRNNK